MSFSRFANLSDLHFYGQELLRKGFQYHLKWSRNQNTCIDRIIDIKSLTLLNIQHLYNKKKQMLYFQIYVQ